MSNNNRDDDEIIIGVLLDQQQTPRFPSSSPSKHPRSSCCCSSCFSQLLSIFLTSLKLIFLENPKFFLSIYVFTSLPLSLLLTLHSLSTRRLKPHIARLEWLSRAVDIWIEADNVGDESLFDLRFLLVIKALFAILIFFFSLLTLTAAVSSAKKWRQPLFKTVRATWARPGITCVVSYLALITWAAIAHALAAAANTIAGIRAAGVATVMVGMAEAYLMTVLSLALVVSVAEERAGVEAVRAGWSMTRGRRVVGWALSGLTLVGSAYIGREMAGVMNGGDWGMSGVYGREWTVKIKYGYMGGLMMMLGWLVLWSYVVFTVFYGECNKKRRVNVASDGYSNSNSLISKELEEY